MIARISLALWLFLLPFNLMAQSSFDVGGDGNKFYPVLFTDHAFWQNRAMELEIGRSDVHTNGTWWGSVIARFRYHTFAWGHGSNFIDADIRSYNTQTAPSFIAGWHDATAAGGTEIIIWLRGATRYWYYSNIPVTPITYDNVANQLPYTEPSGTSHTYLTEVHSYVNNEGLSREGTAYFRGPGRNYFQGSLGVGIKPAAKFHLVGGGYTNNLTEMNQNSTARIDVANPAISLGVGYNLQDQPVLQAFNNVTVTPVNLQINPYGGNVAIGTQVSHGYKLAVAGAIIAEKIKVKSPASTWPDYVFRPGYTLRSVEDLERFVQQHHHLPGIPSEREVKEQGVDVGEMNAKLLKALEEQALYIIELNRKLKEVEEKVNKLNIK